MKPGIALAAGLLALLPSVTFGGATLDAPVVVDLDTGTALGSMPAARFARNDIELIGCGIRFIDDGAGGIFKFGFCQASDADGTFLFCFTENGALLEAIHSISAYSFIQFTSDEDGNCTRIGNSTQSVYIPGALGQGPTK